MRIRCHSILIAMLTFLLAGCGGDKSEPTPDYVAILKDARGLQPGSKVSWMGMTVGEVDSMLADRGMVRVNLDMEQEYKGALPETVSCRVSSGIFGGGESQLKLYAQSSARTLPAGAIIPEAGMTTVVSESVSKEHLLIAGGILVVLVLVGLVVSGIKRLIVLGLAVLFLVFSVNLLRSRWHHVAETFPEVQARIDGVLEQAAANPELAAFASEIQQEATRMLTEAGDQGAHAAGLAYQKITDAIAHEIETRSVTGQREAVDALSRLQQGLQEAVGDNPTSAAP